jgi:hypothetical protein
VRCRFTFPPLVLSPPPYRRLTAKSHILAQSRKALSSYLTPCAAPAQCVSTDRNRHIRRKVSVRKPFCTRNGSLFPRMAVDDLKDGTSSSRLSSPPSSRTLNPFPLPRLTHLSSPTSPRGVRILAISSLQNMTIFSMFIV